jgi:molybdenum cofactor guanylyltransferase
MKKNSIGGIVLAGGLSSRMGTEKGMVQFCGKPLVQWVLDALQPLVSDLVIVANDPVYAQLGHRVVKDDFKEVGPVGGLCTGLRHIHTEASFVLSCDIPLITSDLLRFLLVQLGDASAIAAQTLERRQPLVSVYRKSCLADLIENVAVGRLRMDSALAAAGGGYFTFPGRFEGFDPDCLRNFNSPEDIAGYVCEAGRLRSEGK